MSTNSKILGRLEAVLELIDDKAERVREDVTAVQEVTGQLQRALTVIDEFSDAVEPLYRWIQETNRIRWMTTTELAAELKTSTRHIRYLYETGRLPGYKLTENGHIRFDRREVAEFIKGNQASQNLRENP